MNTTIPYNKASYNYKKIWYFTEHYQMFHRQYPHNTLLFQVGAYYFAFSGDAERIIAHARAESGDPDLLESSLSEPLIIERTELYRHIGILSETPFPIKIIYDAASPR